MRPLTKPIILLAVLFFYAFLYWATKKCDDDCKKRGELSILLKKDRSYIYDVGRCYSGPYSGFNPDTLCVYVKDTIGVNWTLFADTACMYANSVGLARQIILVLNNAIYPPDTLARKQCP